MGQAGKMYPRVAGWSVTVGDGRDGRDGVTTSWEVREGVICVGGNLRAESTLKKHGERLSFPPCFSLSIIIQQNRKSRAAYLN